MSMKRTIVKGIKIASDINAIRRGTIVQRLGRRMIRKAARRLLK